MQIIFLNPFGTFLLDVIVWIVLHLGIGYSCSRFPIEHFKLESRFYEAFSWERDGKIYEDLFRVRSWKQRMPRGSSLYPNTFSMQKLTGKDPVYVRLWIQESIRAEFCHWMMIFPSFLFFLWNNPVGGWLMVTYAIFNNFFPIVAQRFNRPRFRRYLQQTVRDEETAAIPGAQVGPAYNIY
jgi:glycosyl-4,4'-diaponeurosporenoate acyltransferase